MNVNKLITAGVSTIGLAGLFAAPFSYSETNVPSVYAGGSYGYLSVDNGEFDEDDNAYTLYVGGRVNPMLGLEIAYVDFGEQGSSLAQLSTDGISGSVLGHFPIVDSIDIYGRLGILFWDSTVNTSLSDFNSDGQEMILGLGTEMQVNDAFAVRLEYTRYKVELEDNEVTDVFGNQEYDLNQISLGAQLTF